MALNAKMPTVADAICKNHGWFLEFCKEKLSAFKNVCLA